MMYLSISDKNIIYKYCYSEIDSFLILDVFKLTIIKQWGKWFGHWIWHRTFVYTLIIFYSCTGGPVSLTSLNSWGDHLLLNSHHVSVFTHFKFRWSVVILDKLNWTADDLEILTSDSTEGVDNIAVGGKPVHGLATWLEVLLQHNQIFCIIECFSLKEWNWAFMII